MKKMLFIFLPFILIMIPITLFPQATTDLNSREAVFVFLKHAFEAQVTLSEKERSASEIAEMLEPYFTKEYQKIFWKENIYKEENGKYLTYGTDSAKYYIPYYQFSDQTKVVISPEKIYIFEYFPGRMAGPVIYKSHYEGLILVKVSGVWKVNQYFYNLNPGILTEKPLNRQLKQ